MGDYKKRRPRAARKAVGIRELKTHTAEIVRHVREERASYVVTHRGRAVGVILPLDPADDVERESAGAADGWEAFLRAGHRLAPRFQPGVSGVRLLSAARR